MYDTMAGIGAHEVIIETPRHVLSLADLSEEQVREVLWVYRDRLLDLKKDTPAWCMGFCSRTWARRRARVWSIRTAS